VALQTLGDVDGVLIVCQLVLLSHDKEYLVLNFNKVDGGRRELAVDLVVASNSEVELLEDARLDDLAHMDTVFEARA